MKYNVLIVDDELDIRLSMGGLLEDEGFNVKTAESGQQALDMIAEEVPDIVAVIGSPLAGELAVDDVIPVCNKLV